MNRARRYLTFPLQYAFGYSAYYGLRAGEGFLLSLVALGNLRALLKESNNR